MPACQAEPCQAGLAKAIIPAMDLQKLDQYFSDLLEIPLAAGGDVSLNGLQVERKQKDICKVAFAVDACAESIRRAGDAGADMLFVHHGFMWGRQSRLVRQEYERYRLLFEYDIALYAVHLPLDMHPELGNNARMAQILGLENIMPFGRYKGLDIGFRGMLPEALDFEQVRDRLGFASGDVLSMLPFGPEEIRSVGLISGGATRELQQAIDLGLDLFITGDTGHQMYHTALEAGINVLSGGHYATETFGVRAVARRLEKDHGLETLFIDLPTGL